MKKNITNILLIFLFSHTLLQAQKLTGYIYDKTGKEPVSNASIYLDGTSYNTISDANGQFELTSGVRINTPLVISHVNYEKMIVTAPYQAMPDTLFLKEKITEIEEVIVKNSVKEKYSREKKLAAFRDQFLGLTRNGKTSRILNEEDIRLIYDSRSKQLTATSGVPILIENSELGYHIRFDLKEFSVWYSDNSLGNSKVIRSFYLGTSFFQDNGASNLVVNSNREKTYKGSVPDFIRNLYLGTLEESGFVIKKRNKRVLVNDCFSVSYTPEGALVRVKRFDVEEDTKPELSYDMADEMLRLSEYEKGDSSEFPFLDISYGKNRSQIQFQTDSFFIDHFRIITPVDKVVFSGYMGKMRVGDSFPSDYVSLSDSTNMPDILMRGNSIFDHFRRQLEVYPQEKLHLHLDRDYYVPGERIWFKAYLADALTHQSSNLSRYVYVELLDASDGLIHRVMLRPEQGMHYGHIFLSEAMPEGYYTVRAYTSYMDNPDGDYFFRKSIRIGDISGKQAVALKSEKKTQLQDFDVSFFPEGGSLLEGTLCKVAFKALNADGSSAYISGNVIDEEGNIQSSLHTLHAGMGIFGFIPGKGKRYFVECADLNGNQKKFILPDALSDAYALTASYGRDDRLIVGRQKATGVNDVSSMYILLHCRGEILYFNHWKATTPFMTFHKDDLPSGVIHILLFDEQMNPLSERLVFCLNDNQAQLSFSTDKEYYDIRDKITANLLITDRDGFPLSGNYSVSVTDDKDQAVDHSVSILSTMLLTSELKGYIESPAYYFQNNDEKSAQLLDLLMLTHGWRRYDVAEVVKGNVESPRQKPETNLAILGKVTTQLTDRPVKNSSISMMTMSTGEIFETTTSEDGGFVFDEFEFPDSTIFFLRAENSNGRSSVELRLNKKSFPMPKALLFDPHTVATVQNAPIELTGTFMEKASERSKFDDEMRIIHLQDVDIVARKQKKDPEPFSVFSKMASISIGLTELEEKKPATLLDAFAGIPGFTVKAIGEDPNDLEFGGAVFIDDVYMSPEMGNPLEMIRVHDIERIDIFRAGAESGIYGVLGVNGVISITTKRGEGIPESIKEIHHQKTIMPLGYQQPIEFYSPRYETQEQKFDIKPDLRTTIFWKPDLVTAADGKTSFEFYTSDFSTTYSVIIEGLTQDGRIVHEVRPLFVK
ncbi:carboxypeptidase-like regulatory domain-containing protein [Parabacteroides sp. PF5-9]|uniref:carboxypeptidase-like regulatory domain-containing protein n=1 Tax=Parabacteroides sp. PF5-9 TaxID=1742404 RepID=UPI0024767040|nr:carboxypeptidase-like regulatory domain-containing protein [Parabacteroides sp. PF5-9]